MLNLPVSDLKFACGDSRDNRQGVEIKVWKRLLRLCHAFACSNAEIPGPLTHHKISFSERQHGQQKSDLGHSVCGDVGVDRCDRSGPLMASVIHAVL
eukprot:506205-Rhodomonas_salina.1